MSVSDTQQQTAQVAPAPEPPSLEPLRELERRRHWRHNRFAWGLIAPALTVMVLIHIVPMLAGIYVSFLKLNTFTLPQLFGAPWIGIQNYRSLFDASSPLHDGFIQAARNTLIYTGTVVAGTIGGGLGIALLLHRPFPGQRVVRTLMLTPWVIPTFVVATLWQFMWQKDAGIINRILVDYTHVLSHKPVWLLGDNTIWAVVIPSIWRGIPLPMLFFLAGLSAMPPELHEAAKIDGAGAWQRFRHITFPLLRPLIAIQLLFGVIYAAYQFAMPYIMFGSDPGPKADLLMTLIVRQSFENNLFGVGAAVSTLFMLAMSAWVLIWYLAFRRDLQVAA
jgi:multiple sugar transport system permease protein